MTGLDSETLKTNSTNHDADLKASASYKANKTETNKKKKKDASNLQVSQENKYVAENHDAILASLTERANQYQNELGDVVNTRLMTIFESTRASLCLTQKEMANLLGVYDTNYSSAIKKGGAPQKADTFLRFCYIFQYDIDMLMSCKATVPHDLALYEIASMLSQLPSDVLKEICNAATKKMSDSYYTRRLNDSFNNYIKARNAYADEITMTDDTDKIDRSPV